jgi:hypothetical protein
MMPGRRGYQTMDENNAVFFHHDFQQGRDYLRAVCQWAVQDFLEKGHQITVCRPAFAVGCETPSLVRRAIRYGR